MFKLTSWNKSTLRILVFATFCFFYLLFLLIRGCSGSRIGYPDIFEDHNTKVNLIKVEKYKKEAEDAFIKENYTYAYSLYLKALKYHSLNNEEYLHLVIRLGWSMLNDGELSKNSHKVNVAIFILKKVESFKEQLTLTEQFELNLGLMKSYRLLGKYPVEVDDLLYQLTALVGNQEKQEKKNVTYFEIAQYYFSTENWDKGLFYLIRTSFKLKDETVYYTLLKKKSNYIYLAMLFSNNLVDFKDQKRKKNEAIRKILDYLEDRIDHSVSVYEKKLLILMNTAFYNTVYQDQIYFLNGILKEQEREYTQAVYYYQSVIYNHFQAYDIQAYKRLIRLYYKKRWFAKVKDSIQEFKDKYPGSREVDVMDELLDKIKKIEKNEQEALLLEQKKSQKLKKNEKNKRHSVKIKNYFNQDTNL